MKTLHIILGCVFLVYTIQSIKAQGSKTAGDRFPETEVSLLYPEDCYVHNGGRVIDVTRLPAFISDNRAYNDGTHPGETTDALLDAYDWVVARQKEEGSLSWHHHKAAYIIYLPDGTYAVNQPIIHRGDPWIRNNSSHEALCGIRFYGQSRENTILKLVDGAAAFQDIGSPVAVLAFTKHTQNNSVSLNGFQNMTINTGSGNPGAVGVDFQGANISFTRNIKVVSDDGDGHAGVRYPIWPTQGLHSDITIVGFDYGIDVVGGMVANGPVFENITLQDQKIAGFRAQTTISPIRKLHVINPGGPAVQLTTNKGHILVLDSRFEGGPATSAAIEAPADCQSLYARNIEIANGFGDQCIKVGEDMVQTGNLDDEFVAGQVCTLFEGQQHRSLNLPVEESPVIPFDPAGKWVSVESKGAVGNDSQDDSEAIQAALDACDGINKTTVYFRTGGEFRINKPIRVDAGVKRIIWMWGGRINTEDLDPDAAAFKISEASDDPLIFEEYFQHINGNNGFFIEHAVTRPVVCRNLRGSRDFSNYTHTSGNRENKLFLDNVAHMISEGCNLNNRCWARWVNTETAEEVEFLNSGGVFWVLGYKCEDEAVNFRTINGGYTEVLGGIINQYRGSANHYAYGRVFELIDSYGSFIASSSGPTDQEYDTIIFEQRKGDGKVALFKEFPVREDNKIHVPLFAGYSKPLALRDAQREPDKETCLDQNFPNPFRTTTEIGYRLSQPCYASLSVFDSRGRQVDEIFSGMQAEGNHSVRFDGSCYSPGLFLYRLRAGHDINTRVMILAE